MKLNKKFLFIFIFIFFITIAVASAQDLNESDVVDASDDSAVQLNENDIVNVDNEPSNASDTSEVIKTTPKISMTSKNVKSKDTLEFTFKNSSGNPLKSKKLTVNLNNHKYSIKTNSKGIAKLKISLDAKKYK